MKKLILTLILLAPAFMSAETPSGPECTAEALRFFPEERVELLIGESYMMGMSNEACLFQAEGGKMFNGVFISKTGPELDIAFDAYTRANPGQEFPGTSCDRYVTAEGYENLNITAQKGNYLFIIASSIGLEDLIDAAEYACAQVAGAAGSETSGPFSSNYEGGVEETSVTPGFGYLASLFMPILIGLVVLVAVGLIAWSLMHKKKVPYQVPTNMMPPPVAPPRPTPPPPPIPQAPVAPPVFTPPPPPSFTPPPPAPPAPAMPPTQPPPSMPQ